MSCAPRAPASDFPAIPSQASPPLETPSRVSRVGCPSVRLVKVSKRPARITETIYGPHRGGGSRLQLRRDPLTDEATVRGIPTIRIRGVPKCEALYRKQATRSAD
eukprot:2686218-Pyramimonas_sp.AAC.1